VIQKITSLPFRIKNGPIDSFTETTSKFWVSITDQFKQVGDSLKDLENIKNAESVIPVEEDGLATTTADTAASSSEEIPSKIPSEIPNEI